MIITISQTEDEVRTLLGRITQYVILITLPRAYRPQREFISLRVSHRIPHIFFSMLILSTVLLSSHSRSLNNVGGIDINIYDIEGIGERAPNPNAPPQKRQGVIIVSK